MYLSAFSFGLGSIWFPLSGEHTLFFYKKSWNSDGRLKRLAQKTHIWFQTCACPDFELLANCKKGIASVSKSIPSWKFESMIFLFPVWWDMDAFPGGKNPLAKMEFFCTAANAAIYRRLLGHGWTHWRRTQAPWPLAEGYQTTGAERETSFANREVSKWRASCVAAI